MPQDAVALLTGEINPKTAKYWLNANTFKSQILHVQKLENISTVNGLQADPFVIPDGINVKDITGLAIIDCDTGTVSCEYGFQVPAVGIQCLEHFNVLCLRDWCAGRDDSPALSDCDVCEDPCLRYERLYCKYERLVCGETKVSVTFSDGAVTYNRANMDKLEQMVSEAKAACEQKRGVSSSERGRVMRHSCSRRYYGKRGCC